MFNLPTVGWRNDQSNANEYAFEAMYDEDYADQDEAQAYWAGETDKNGNCSSTVLQHLLL